FFISSRRRHTMSKRDWSSDVCSSDLTQLRTVCRNFFRDKFHKSNCIIFFDIRRLIWNVKICHIIIVKSFELKLAFMRVFEPGFVILGPESVCMLINNSIFFGTGNIRTVTGLVKVIYRQGIDMSEFMNQVAVLSRFMEIVPHIYSKHSSVSRY